MSIKQKITRKLMERKLKSLPKHERDMMLAMMDKNPDLFEKIAKETEALTKQGKSEMAAGMEVMRKYQKEIQNLQRQMMK